MASDGRWGHCRSCRYFGSPAHVPLGTEEALCKQPELSKFELTIFGASGCNGWELRPGLPPEIEEPSFEEQPPAE
jgi:hypothetical protein